MRSVSLPLSGLARYITAALASIARDTHETALVAAIGGYPYLGKTTLAHKIGAGWTKPAFVLPTESVIRSRAARLELGYDGSSVDSHDIPSLIKMIQTIRSGGRVVLPRYSWLNGNFDSHQENPILCRDGLLLIDGSVSTTKAVLPLVDAAFALRPESRGDWIEKAIARDVADRNWSFELASKQNESKARTVDEQLASFGENDNEYLITVAI